MPLSVRASVLPWRSDLPNPASPPPDASHYKLAIVVCLALAVSFTAGVFHGKQLERGAMFRATIALEQGVAEVEAGRAINDRMARWLEAVGRLPPQARQRAPAPRRATISPPTPTDSLKRP